MKLMTVLLAFCLITAALSGTTSCPQGQANIANGSCWEVEYIEGCFRYDSEAKCAECEFNYDLVKGSCSYNEKDKK